MVLDEDSLGRLRERVEAAGIESEDRDGALLLRDPWDNAVAFLQD